MALFAKTIKEYRDLEYYITLSKYEEPESYWLFVMNVKTNTCEKAEWFNSSILADLEFFHQFDTLIEND